MQKAMQIATRLLSPKHLWLRNTNNLKDKWNFCIFLTTQLSQFGLFVMDDRVYFRWKLTSSRLRWKQLKIGYFWCLMCYLPLKKPIQRDATKDSVERGKRYECWYDKYHSVLVFVVSPHLIILYSRNCSSNLIFMTLVSGPRSIETFRYLVISYPVDKATEKNILSGLYLGSACRIDKLMCGYFHFVTS